MESSRNPINSDFVAKLVKEYGINSNWFTTGKGQPKQDEKPVDQLLTDINIVVEDMNTHKTQIKFMEATQKHLINRIDLLEKALQASKK